MLDIPFLIACALLAYAGTKFVLWVIRRSLPVPLGGFMWLRFFFWWTASLFAAVIVFVGFDTASGILVFDVWELGERLDPSIVFIGSLILSAPYWVGLIKGISIQVTHRLSE